MGIESEELWGQSQVALMSADTVVAAVPHMVGFPPEDSVVLVGLAREGADGPSTVRLVQRFDTPDEQPTGEVTSRVAGDATAPMARAGVSEVVIVVFGSTVPDTDRALPAASLVDELVVSLEARDIPVRDALYTDGSSRWSYGCDDPSCCPPEGRLIPDEARTLMAAEFASHGAAMAASRQSLTDEIAPDPGASEVREAAAVAVDSTPTTTAELEAWRDDRITETTHVLASDGDAGAMARSIAGLRDIRVRDTIVWEMTQQAGRQQHAIDALSAMLRCAPDGQVAPTATTLAVAQWMAGDGARANAALARALADEPDYALAQMIDTAIRSGMPPQTFRDCVTDLPRDTCRNGIPTQHIPGADSPDTGGLLRPATRPAAPAVEPISSRPPTPGLAS